MKYVIDGKVFDNNTSPEYMSAFGVKLSKLIDKGPEGLKAIADIIAKAVDVEVEAEIVTPLILDRHVLPIGAQPTYQKRSLIQAVWVAIGADARRQDIDSDEVTAPLNRILANPTVDVSVLRDGNVGSIKDLISDSAETIRKEIDKRTMTVVEAAIQAAMTETITGGVITIAGLAGALGKMYDKELKPAIIAMRGDRVAEMQGLTGFSDEMINEMLWKKGVLGTYAGAMILNTMSIANNQDVYIFPEKRRQLGKYPIREKLQSEILRPSALKYEITSWSQVGQIILNADKMAKLRINA